MDIINRLKSFVLEKNIPVTQFADICNISRPTLSQILNGRNKKISDEIISKIHLAFPELSIYWLMFGEGSMLNAADGVNNISSVDLKNQDNILESHQILKSERDNSGKDFPGLFAGNIGNMDRKTIPVSASTNKTITKIVVFYNDNSYESFGPNNI